jgi:hypothetical protein
MADGSIFHEPLLSNLACFSQDKDPPFLSCVPNPSKPIDNLKAEGPSLSLYSVDTHNESKKAVSVHRLQIRIETIFLKFSNFFI